MTVHNSVKCPAFSNRKGEIDYFGLPCAMHNVIFLWVCFLLWSFCICIWIQKHGCVCVSACVCGCVHEFVLVCVHEKNYLQHTDVKGPHTTIGVSILLWVSFALHQF